MKDSIELQLGLPEAPEAEKASGISVAACIHSNVSWFACFQK